MEAAIAVAVEKASDRSAAQAFAFARECMQMHQHSTAELEGSKGRSLLKGCYAHALPEATHSSARGGLAIWSRQL